MHAPSNGCLLAVITALLQLRKQRFRGEGKKNDEKARKEQRSSQTPSLSLPLANKKTTEPYKEVWKRVVWNRRLNAHVKVAICFSCFLEYNPPNPQPGQGIHRFYFFVFEQKERLVDGIHIANRCGFNIDAFIQDFQLKPVAMNMFRSEYQNVVVISELILT